MIAADGESLTVIKCESVTIAQLMSRPITMIARSRSKSGSNGADPGIMAISAIGITSSSGLGAVAAGLRAEMKARTLRQMLEFTSMLDRDMDRGLRMLESEGRAIARGGIEKRRMALLGEFIDAVA